MPKLFTPTDIAADATVGSATFRGRVWKVAPPYVSRLDASGGARDNTTQAADYRAKVGTIGEIDVRVWYGIRAATCPRFEPAVAYAYPAGVHDATAQPPVPPQTSGAELASGPQAGRPGGPYPPDAGVYNWHKMGTYESEEAAGLLNIFAPATAGPHPVVFMVHGGGWGVYHALAPQQWAAQLSALFNIIVVTPEYRLSTFGHLPHPDLNPTEPSVAYTEIKECLRWTHTNIAQFGGDASKIAIAGTSAGGAACQLLLEDDTTQAWFSCAWIDSGGGASRYPTSDFYNPRVVRFENVWTTLAPHLSCLDPQYRTIQEAFDDGRDFEWVLKNALRPEHVQAVADRAVTVSGVDKVLAGEGNLSASFRSAHENVFPFRRSTYATAIDAAKDGKFRKPCVLTFAGNEGINLLGSNYVTLRDALVNTSLRTLNGWAQRLGYANYIGFLNATWSGPQGLDDWAQDLPGGFSGYAELLDIPPVDINTQGGDAWAQRLGYANFADWEADEKVPTVGLQSDSSATYNPANGDLTVMGVPDLEYRWVLYTHAVFGYPAWRIARAIEANGQTATLAVNNFSANGQWAGHSQMVTMMFGTPEWNVGGVQNVPNETPPGSYANVRMDGLYVTLGIVMPKLARFAATGDPEGAYSNGAGFTIFDGNAPADQPSATVPGDFPGVWSSYDPVEPNHLNWIGKYFGPPSLDLNAIDPILNSQRDARSTYAEYMNGAYMEYMALLEP